MCAEIVRRQTPEDRELHRKKAELSRLQAKLAELELDRATLQAELHAFESRYLRVVGALYAELDEIEARIAELLSHADPANDKARRASAEARTRADESAREAGGSRARIHKLDFVPSESLKKLYREVARRIHPDLANNEAERTRRTALMTEANQAYEDGNEERLRSILAAWEDSAESVPGETVGAELVRTIRKIAQIEERIEQIVVEIGSLRTSDVWQLRDKAEEASRQGRDLLHEMAANVDIEIADRRTRLSALQRGLVP